MIGFPVLRRHCSAPSSVIHRMMSTSSSRGQNAVGLLPSYLTDARNVTKYSAQTPEGALQLGVAESLMLEDLLVPALNQRRNVGADTIYYQPTPGRDDFRKAMAHYIESLLDLQHGRLDTEGLVVGAGCNAVLENLCFCLAEAGDAVLIPTPYYAAFEFDLVARAGLHVQPLKTQAFHGPPEAANDPTVYFPNTASLDAAFDEARKNGHSPKILLLSHPNNPLGVCYPPEVMKLCIDWCNERKVHLVSDEIYAGSIYRPGLANFESALKLADNQGLGPYIHWVYALSKDFALSGLRVGAAYSENMEIRLPMQKLNDLCQISSTTQVWVAEMLTRKEDDRDWVESFRNENHERLVARGKALESLLDEFGVPYLTPSSGLFIWLDFSQFLSDKVAKSESERELYLSLVNDHGLLLTPGESMRNEKPGFFRCVFTAANDEEFSLALERLRSFFKRKA